MSPVQIEQEHADKHMNPTKLDAAACFQSPMCSSKKQVLRHASAARACSQCPSLLN